MCLNGVRRRGVDVCEVCDCVGGVWKCVIPCVDVCDVRGYV